MQNLLEEDVRAFFEVESTAHGSEAARKPRYNIGPGQDIWVVRVQHGREQAPRRSLDALHWGLVPHFAKDKKGAYRAINARGESVDKTPLFRGAFEKRRCLVVAHAFYEWVKQGKQKQPFAIARADDEPLAFAGLWENWLDKETGEWLRSVAIITTQAEGDLRELHDRTPVMLERADFPRWLGEQPASPAELKALLVATAQPLRIWPIDPRMNRTQVDEPSILTPIELGAS
jgi:putative SOS response-associated peptidase YedK